MEKRTIGKTGFSVSRLCLGTMTFGAQADESTAAAMVDFYLDRGGNFIDTANVYAAGRSEEILGRILKGRRDRIVLASKVGIKAGEGPDESGLSRAAIVKGIEGSLRRLQADYLDIYYLHVPDYATRLEESLEAVGELVRKGMVRHLGVSNYAAWQVCRLLWLAEKNGFPPVAITQPMYNLLSRGIEQEFLPMCEAFGLATAAYNPLAGGLLTGKHRPENVISGTRFDKNQAYLDRYWHRANFDAVQELAAVAKAAGRSLVSVSLNWMLHHTAADCVILGASRLEQLQENLIAAEEGALPRDLIHACEAVWAKLRGPSPRYNR